MEITRQVTRQIEVGSVKIGGGAPISVQSMTIPHPRDVKATLEQIHQLEEAGCELIRVAVPDEEAAQALPKIKAQMRVPLIADIHFDHLCNTLVYCCYYITRKYYLRRFGLCLKRLL